MVKNMWKQIVLVCGCHEEEVIMNIIQGPSSLFYACPKYYPENRENGERACANRINLVDYEKMVDYLSDKIEESLLEGNKEDLTNLNWVYKGVIEFKVLEHKNGMIKVRMKNKKALK